MAGVKGRSGGARPRSGPKPKKPLQAPALPENAAAPASLPASNDSATIKAAETPLEFMLRVMNDPTQSLTVRSRMAITAAQYVHTKSHDGGKKDAKQAAAGKVGLGKFATAAPPRLAVVKN